MGDILLISKIFVVDFIYCHLVSVFISSFHCKFLDEVLLNEVFIYGSVRLHCVFILAWRGRKRDGK